MASEHLQYQGLSDDERAAELERLRRLIDGHRGTRAFYAWDRVGRVLEIFVRNARDITDLLDAVGSSADLQAQVMSRQDGAVESVRRNFIHEMDRGLHNLLAAAVTLVDHTRTLVEGYAGSTFESEWNSRNIEVASAPVSVFLRDFRNYLLHYGAIPWQMKLDVANTDDGGQISSFELSAVSDDLLGAGYKWKVKAREYIGSQGEALPILPAIREYVDLTMGLHDWRAGRFRALHEADIRAADDLRRRYNLVLSRGAYESHEQLMARIREANPELR